MRQLTGNLLGRLSRPRPGRSRSSRSSYLVSLGFFVAYFLFLWLYIEPQLVYHYYEMTRKGLFFETGWQFLQDCLNYPGGLSEYIASFFTQLCYFPWVGALCISLIAWAIYRLTASLAAVAADRLWRFICYVPALLILMICGRYENPLNTAVVLLVSMFFSVLYEKFSLRLGRARVILFLIVCGVLYYIAGSAALLFVAVAALNEIFKRGKIVFGLLYLLFGAGVCWLLGAYVFELEASEVYLCLSPFIPTRQNEEEERWARLFEECLFVILPVIVLLVDSGRRLTGIKDASRPTSPGPPEKSSGAKKALYFFYRSWFKQVIQISLLTLIAVPSAFFSVDRESKKGIQVSYFACRRMWPEVLTVARKVSLKRYFPFCNHSVNRALYYTGRLGDRMFTYPQDYRTADLVFCLVEGGNVVFMERPELCLELGLVNVAEKIAHEFLEGAFDNPYTLKQFALLNIVKGQVDTARVFLGALSKNLVYGREAKELLRRLERDPKLENDKRVQQLRSVMMNRDIAYSAFNEDIWLTELLHRNKYNRMAFEYLMAHYLLTKQLDKFIENLPRLDDFDYSSIPRHYQEAIVLYIGTRQKNVDLGGRELNPEIIRQYSELNRVGKKYSNDRTTTWRAMAPKFGRTYFFYFAFGASGITQ